jgi:Na+/melibiose symporter-like transporter
MLLALLVANEVFRGFLGTVLGIVFVAMLADTIDLQEDVTGHRQEGVFAAALAFSGKATAGLGSVIAGVLLAQVIHWPANGAQGEIGPAIILRLGMIVGVWTPMLLVVPLLFAARYSITRERRQATRRSLDRRRTLAMAESIGPLSAEGNP